MPVRRTERLLTSARLEVRVDGDAATVAGYASTFGQPYDMGFYRETVRAGAFTKTLAEQPDVRFLINHTGLPLARTTAGSLRLSQDSTGLHQEATFNMARSDVRDAVLAIQDGAATQMSFGFRTIRDEWHGGESGLEERELVELALNDGDVSLVTYPANPNTSIGLRSARQLVADEPDRARALYGRLRAAAGGPLEARDGRVLSAATVKQLKAVMESLQTVDSENQDALDTLTLLLSGGSGDTPQTNSAPRHSDVTVLRARARLLELV